MYLFARCYISDESELRLCAHAHVRTYVRACVRACVFGCVCVCFIVVCCENHGSDNLDWKDENVSQGKTEEKAGIRFAHQLLLVPNFLMLIRLAVFVHSSRKYPLVFYSPKK